MFIGQRAVYLSVAHSWAAEHFAPDGAIHFV